VVFGEEALRVAEVPEDEIQAIVADIRRRDKERLQLEINTGSGEASRGLLIGNLPKPAPLIEPKRESKILNPEGAAIAPAEQK
jgi:glutathione-regulated potassium-efflux system protein KefB